MIIYTLPLCLGCKTFYLKAKDLWVICGDNLCAYQCFSREERWEWLWERVNPNSPVCQYQCWVGIWFLLITTCSGYLKQIRIKELAKNQQFSGWLLNFFENCGYISKLEFDLFLEPQSWTVRTAFISDREFGAVSNTRPALVIYLWPGQGSRYTVLFHRRISHLVRYSQL
jgi:hypothetical protein